VELAPQYQRGDTCERTRSSSKCRRARPGIRRR
jgi:hypothetical protein